MAFPLPNSPSEFIFRRAGEPASPLSLNLLSRVDAEFSARARCACICGESVGAGDRPRGARGAYSVRAPGVPGGGMAQEYRHVRRRETDSPRARFSCPNRRRGFRSCPAGNGALSGEKRQKGEKEEGEEESAASPRTYGGNMACVPGPLAGWSASRNSCRCRHILFRRSLFLPGAAFECSTGNGHIHAK